MNLNVIHIINRFEVGGVEVGVTNLLKNSKSKNYKVLSILGGDAKFIENLSSTEKENLILCKGWVSAFYHIFRLKPDVVISSLWRAHFLSIVCCLFLSFKRFHFVHSARYAHVIDKIITKASLFFSHHVFFDSSESYKFISARNHLVDYSIVPMNISFLSEPIHNLKKKTLDFVFVGRLSKEKNIADSLRFIYFLKAYDSAVTFDIYGRDDGDFNKIKDTIAELGLNENVRINNSLSPLEVERVMSNYSFYLQTSFAEGMAISVFQSISCGLLPVVSPVGEIPKYTRHGKNSFHLNLNDIKGSVDDFYEIFKKTQFSEYKFNYIFDSENYPLFHEEFFSILNSIVRDDKS